MSRRLRRITAIGGAVSGVLVMVVASNGLADAQVALPLGVTPGSGPPGTEITVSGDQCIGDPGEVVSVGLALENGQTHDTSPATPDEAGSWTGTLTVPVDPGLAGMTLTITAVCEGGDVAYADGSFVVDGTPPTEPPPTSTTTTTIPSTPGPGRSGPPSAGAPSAPPAQAGLSVDLMPPATPVAAQPTHTG